MTLFESHALNFDSYPTAPHGGKLVNRVVQQQELPTQLELAKTLPVLRIDLEAAITIEMIATGVLSPVEGFMLEDDYKSVLNNGRLADGTVWPVPLSFAPTGKRNSEVMKTLKVGDEVALVGADDRVVAIVTVEDLFDYDKNERAKKLFWTTVRSLNMAVSIHTLNGAVNIRGNLWIFIRTDLVHIMLLYSYTVD